MDAPCGHGILALFRVPFFVRISSLGDVPLYFRCRSSHDRALLSCHLLGNSSLSSTDVLRVVEHPCRHDSYVGGLRFQAPLATAKRQGGLGRVDVRVGFRFLGHVLVDLPHFDFG